MKTPYPLILLLAAGCATQKPATFPQPLPPLPSPPMATASGLRTKGLVGPRISAQVAPNGVTLLVSRSITPPPAVAFGWDASPDPDATGYNLYMGYGPRLYTNVFDAGTNLTFTVSNLAFSASYYFTVTATAPGRESDYCNEVVYTSPSQLLPPGTMRIQSSWASTIGGPWLADTNWPAVVITNPIGNMLWRLEATRQ